MEVHTCIDESEFTILSHCYTQTFLPEVIRQIFFHPPQWLAQNVPSLARRRWGYPLESARSDISAMEIVYKQEAYFLNTCKAHCGTIVKRTLLNSSRYSALKLCQVLLRAVFIHCSTVAIT